LPREPKTTILSTPDIDPLFGRFVAEEKRPEVTILTRMCRCLAANQVLANSTAGSQIAGSNVLSTEQLFVRKKATSLLLFSLSRLAAKL
jgi:hypothetical protein